MRGETSIRLTVVLAALYVIEGCGLLSAMIVYKHAVGRHGAAFVAGVVAMVGATAYLLYAFRRAGAAPRRQFLLALAMNGVTVVVSAAISEAAVRLWSQETPLGIVVGRTRLLPYRWEDVVERNRRLLDTSPTPISYFVGDELLGWTVGPNRQSRHGLYSSSPEGIRSARTGVAYSARAPARRVALVGDSYTFALEVPFEQSWGHVLEEHLGPQVQILNFGVDGYGVDQAYLRYVRDVRPWHPDVVIFGFIAHDLHRSLSVYTFLSFPEWGFPFAKPRFVMKKGKPELLNHPLPSPQTILSYASIADLPFVTYEPEYHADQWEWNVIYHSHLARFLVSRFPRYYVSTSETSDDVLKSVNIGLLASFVELVRRDGAVPLIVYFPSRGDFKRENRDIKNAVAAELFRRGVQILDLTPCLEQVETTQRFIEGRPHYSAHGNHAVAACLSGTLKASLSR